MHTSYLSNYVLCSVTIRWGGIEGHWKERWFCVWWLRYDSIFFKNVIYVPSHGCLLTSKFNFLKFVAIHIGLTEIFKQDSSLLPCMWSHWSYKLIMRIVFMKSWHFFCILFCSSDDKWIDCVLAGNVECNRRHGGGFHSCGCGCESCQELPRFIF